jgi:hypothetical protein
MPHIRASVIFLAALVATAPASADDASRYFAIEVIDADTNRGIPLVELKTTNDIRHYTDSNGLVAFDEPGLMNGKVHFTVSSPGYEMKADGFGIRGVALTPEPGKSARITLTRTQIAERLYRVTGQGIYADTIRLGRIAPLANPTLSGRVTGQDSVLAWPYQGTIRWFWGDTAQPGYPLGNYGTSGATSPLETDPAKGVDLTYFVDDKGFSRKMVPLDQPGAVWVDAITVLKDAAGRERMFGSYQRLKTLGTVLERGLMEFDDATQTFKPIRETDLKSKCFPHGQSLPVTVDDLSYIYFACPFPLVRVRAEWDALTDPSQYESFTCLKSGTRYEKEKSQLDRDATGKLHYAWKRDTDPIGPAEQRDLVAAGKMKPDEGSLQLRDIQTKEPVLAHAGTVRWNAFRKRYVMLFTQAGGKASYLGEVWYAEADSPEGPWKSARHVATHPKYSFYNVCHHDFFDQQDGRIIYFEGTYTAEFSGAPFKTPRYDYNQLMYRLDLADPRLVLPKD